MGAARLIWIAAFALSAAAVNVEGTWRANFAGPEETWPKSASPMTFDLHAEGGVVTGTAHIGNWPADTPVSEGVLEGNHISFVVISDKVWLWNSPPQPATAHPRLVFNGTVDGDDMKLTLTFDAAMVEGEKPKPATFEVLAKKVPASERPTDK